MVERSHKPSAIPVQNTAAADTATVKVDSERVVLSLSSGESVTILLHGATITSWKSASGQEHLFLSSDAVLDGTAAIRGGIPLVFPIFGPAKPPSKLPQHGFARTSKWELLGKTSDSPTNVQVDFGLGPQNLTPEVREMWPHDFGLIYTVNLMAGGVLETKILVRNAGSETVGFNVLFHTYFRVPDITTIRVEGLQNTTYTDKVLSGAQATESNPSLSITGETDRVYAEVPGLVTIKDGNKPIYTVERTNLEDVVVWNPWEEGAKKIKDFGPKDGWRNMLCVEAGSVVKVQTLESGSVWEGGQVLSIL